MFNSFLTYSFNWLWTSLEVWSTFIPENPLSFIATANLPTFLLLLKVRQRLLTLDWPKSSSPPGRWFAAWLAQSTGRHQNYGTLIQSTITKWMYFLVPWSIGRCSSGIYRIRSFHGRCVTSILLSLQLLKTCSLQYRE